MSSHEIDTWEPVNLNTLPDRPPIQPTLGQLGDIGLVYPGKRHVFSGPQESAKTLMAYLIGLEVVREGGVWILIDFEMGGYDARGRLIDLGATPEDLNSIRYLEPEQPATPDRLQRLLTHHPSLVTIDAAAGAYDLQGLDDNKRVDVEKITRLYVRTFWRAGIATIFLDHVVKNNETRGNYAIGSERKVGGADVHLGFTVISPISRGHSGLYKISTHKDRGGFLKRGILAELELTSAPETHAITYELRAAQETDADHPWMPTKVMQHLSELLEKQTEPISRSQLITLAGGKKSVATTAIDRLVALKYATETTGPRGAKLLETTKRFTVLEWESKDNDPPVPTRSQLFPEQVHPVVPPTPPTGGVGREQVDADKNRSPVPKPAGWLDHLDPVNIPPADGIPF